MITSTIEIRIPEAEDVSATEDTLQVELSDGRTLSVPLAWYPRLVHATREEREHWELIGGGPGNSLAGFRRRPQCGRAYCGPPVRGKPAFVQAVARSKTCGPQCAAFRPDGRRAGGRCREVTRLPGSGLLAQHIRNKGVPKTRGRLRIWAGSKVEWSSPGSKAFGKGCPEANRAPSACSTLFGTSHW